MFPSEMIKLCIFKIIYELQNKIIIHLMYYYYSLNVLLLFT